MIRRNVIMLGLGQALSLGVPLLVFPYLSRTLGTVSLGKYALAIAFSQYAIIPAEWGFNLSATREVSQNRQNILFVRDKYATITAVKSALFLLVSALLLLFAHIAEAAIDSKLLLLALSAALIQVLIPVWLIQGLERFKYLIQATLAARILSLPLTFLLVRNQHDVAPALWVTIVSNAIILTWTTCAHWQYVQIKWPTKDKMGQALRGGSTIFLSSVFTNIYTQSVIVVLGFTSGQSQVAIFSVADKVRQVLALPFGPLMQGSYPRMVEYLKSSPISAIASLKKIVTAIIAYSACILVTIAVFGDTFIGKVFGAQYHDSFTVVKILAIIPLVTGISGAVGILFFVAAGSERKTLNAVLFGAIVSTLICIPFTSAYGAVGAAATTVIAECIIMIIVLLQWPRARRSIIASASP